MIIIDQKRTIKEYKNYSRKCISLIHILYVLYTYRKIKLDIIKNILQCADIKFNPFCITHKSAS